MRMSYMVLGTVTPEPTDAAFLEEEVRWAAEAGVGFSIFARSGIERVVGAVAEYRRLFQEIHGREAPAPSVVDHVYSAADEAQGFQVVREHLGPGHFNTISGYEGEPDWPTEGGDGQSRERRVVELVGTPELLVQTLLERQNRLGDYEQVCQFSFGSLPYAEASANAQRFARDVLPQLRAAGVLEAPSSTD